VDAVGDGLACGVLGDGLAGGALGCAVVVDGWATVPVLAVGGALVPVLGGGVSVAAAPVGVGAVGVALVPVLDGGVPCAPVAGVVAVEVVPLGDGAVPTDAVSAAARLVDEPYTAANAMPAARAATPRRIRGRSDRFGPPTTTPVAGLVRPGAGRAIATRSDASRLNSACGHATMSRGTSNVIWQTSARPAASSAADAGWLDLASARRIKSDGERGGSRPASRSASRETMARSWSATWYWNRMGASHGHERPDARLLLSARPHTRWGSHSRRDLDCDSCRSWAAPVSFVA
jgi:hypothetical protein